MSQAYLKLFEIVQTQRGLRRGFGAAQRGQKQTREQPDDREDDEKFDEGEARDPIVAGAERRVLF